MTAPEGLSALAYRAAALLDTDADGNADRVTAIAAAARDWVRGSQERARALIDRCRLQPSPGLAEECRDIEKTLGIARGAHDTQARRRALALIETKENEEQS